MAPGEKLAISWDILGYIMGSSCVLLYWLIQKMGYVGLVHGGFNPPLVVGVKWVKDQTFCRGRWNGTISWNFGIYWYVDQCSWRLGNYPFQTNAISCDIHSRTMLIWLATTLAKVSFWFGEVPAFHMCATLDYGFWWIPAMIAGLVKSDQLSLKINSCQVRVFFIRLKPCFGLLCYELVCVGSWAIYRNMCITFSPSIEISREYHHLDPTRTFGRNTLNQ